MEKSLMTGILLGFVFGFMRFVLDDKWNCIPKNICRFCLSFWIIVFSNLIILFYHEQTSIINSIDIAYLGCSIATAIVVASFSYVYLKNAN